MKPLLWTVPVALLGLAINLWVWWPQHWLHWLGLVSITVLAALPPKYDPLIRLKEKLLEKARRR